MPERIISRIQSINDRIKEIEKFNKVASAKQKNIPEQKKTETAKFSDILKEVMDSKSLQTNTILNDFSPAENKLSDNKIDSLRDIYQKLNSAADTDSNWENIIVQAGKKYNLDPNLIRAIIQVESGYNPNAVSHAGAQGLMQLMPDTAKEMNVTDVFNPEQNIFGGARYFREMLDRYRGDLVKALAAYNAGPEAVDKARGIPNYTETQLYVPRVLNAYHAINKEE